MADFAPIQVAFNGGQLGPRMAGRVDLNRYRSGCRTLSNFIPTVQGPALKRSGTRFVKRTRATGTTQTRLIPFEFSRDQAYILELSEGHMRFLRDSGAVLESSQSIVGSPTAASPCSITVTGHGYSTGDEVFVTGSSLLMINDQFFTITVTGADTFTIGFSSVGETTGTGGTVARTYSISDGVSSNSLPWAAADLNGIQFAQSADVMYLVHADYPPHKLVRVSDTEWTCTEVAFDWPPFRDENTSDTTVYASASTGATVTIQASADIFTADMVGSYIRLGELPESTHPKWRENNDMSTEFSGGVAVNDRVHYEGRVYRLDNKSTSTKTGTIPPTHFDPLKIESDRAAGEGGYRWEFVNRGFGYGKIETFTDANTIVVDVDNEGVPFPNSVVGSTLATKKWAIGAFNEEFGYPTSVAIFENRVWFGGTDRDPQSLWASRTNLYDDFEIITDQADSSLLFALDSNRINAILWMTGEDALIIGTRGGEFTAQSNSQDEGITPDNIKVKQRSVFGTATDVSPQFVDSALLMVQRNGRRIHELIYDYDRDGYQGIDLTAMSNDIINSKVETLAYQASPFRQLFANSTNGELVGLTYVREDDVVAWAEFPIASVSGGTGIVESIAVIPHPDGYQDQLWMVVRRTIAAGQQRWIEIMEKPFDESDALEDGFFVDSGLTYTGSAATTIYGLLHLANQNVSYLRSGVAGTGTVDSKGKLTVTSTTKIHIGLPVVAQLETMDFENGKPPVFSTLGDRSRTVAAVFRLLRCGQGFEYGQRLTGTLDTWTQETSLYTGDTPELTLPGGFSRAARVAIRHQAPTPCTVVAVMPYITSEAG